MLIFLHGAGDGVWDVMNSQSLPRLLSRDQSTAFDPRKSWEFDFDGRHYANATFADELGFVVVMPQGWDATMRPGWSRPRLERPSKQPKLPLRRQTNVHQKPQRQSDRRKRRQQSGPKRQNRRRPSAPPGCVMAKSVSANPRASINATDIASPSTSVFMEDVVGARFNGQASRSTQMTWPLRPA